MEDIVSRVKERTRHRRRRRDGHDAAKAGLPAGMSPKAWVLENPDPVRWACNAPTSRRGRT